LIGSPGDAAHAGCFTMILDLVVNIPGADQVALPARKLFFEVGLPCCQLAWDSANMA